ncbi:let-363, partial [Pristionchus pacificus]
SEFHDCFFVTMIGPIDQRKASENASEMDRCRDGTGKGVAEFYARMIIQKKGEERYKVASSLYKYLSCEFRDETVEFQLEFINFIDSKPDSTEQNFLFDLMNPKDSKAVNAEGNREAATILIVLLAEPMLTTEGGGARVVRFAHYLLKVLLTMEERGMELAARGLAFLIQVSKTYAAELVERCLDQSLEWAEEDLSEKSEQRRLASAILLRELALFTSTSFFLRANAFFRTIFKVIRFPKPNVRMAAANALHAALGVTSQREAKQKSEWYKKCFNEALNTLIETGDGLGKDERCHCMLLVFNELLRIADAQTEKARICALGHANDRSREEITVGGSPLDFLSAERFLTTVESRTAKALVSENIKVIYDKVMEARYCRQHDCVLTLIEVLPRLASWLTVTQLASCVEILLPHMHRSSQAQISAGLFVLQQPKALKKYVPQMMNVFKDALSTTKKKKTPIDLPRDTKLFVLLTYIVRAFGKDVTHEVKDVLPLLLTTPLSKAMKETLREIYNQIEEVKTEVLDGLLEQLSIILMNEPLPPKTAAPTMRPVPANIIVAKEKVPLCILALETLGEFQFQRHSLHYFMQYVADGYLVCHSATLRFAAVKSCTAMLLPFIVSYEKSGREQRVWVLALVHSVLKCLCSVAVVDSDPEVRMCVVTELSKGDICLLSHLAQPEILQLLRLCLRDEKLEMQEQTVNLLGKIGQINPALVLPRLRRVLAETIIQLSTSGDGRLEQHSARLIALMSHQSPKFMVPYMGQVLEGLLPKIRFEQKFSDVTVQVLHAISELAMVGGAEMVRSIPLLFPMLIQFITDSSSLARREAGLRALGHLSASTAYVVDPYRDHKNLLEILLSLMKNEMSQSMRRLTMKVLGTLGALDPYAHKVFTGAIVSGRFGLSAALSLPTVRQSDDPRMNIIQWFNYEKCTLLEFYPHITIANLLMMLENETYSNHYAEITQDLLSILKTLGKRCQVFVPQVVPKMLETTRKSKKDSKNFFLKQLTDLLMQVKGGSKPYLPQIFEIIRESWNAEESHHASVIGVIEAIGKCHPHSFSPYTHEVIPYILEAMRSDKAMDRKLTDNCLSCIVCLSGSLTQYLHLMISPILTVVNDGSAPTKLREKALECIYEIGVQENLSDYTPHIMQGWMKAIHSKPLEKSALKLLKIMTQQKWKHLVLFHRNIECSLKGNELRSDEYNQYIWERDQMERRAAEDERLRREGKMPPVRMPDDTPDDEIPINQTIANRANQSSAGPSHTEGGTESTRRVVADKEESKKQAVSVKAIEAAISVEANSTKEDWSAWLTKLRLVFIRFSSSSAIRAVYSMSEQHSQLAKDIFVASFMSVWTEVSKDVQDYITANLKHALQTCDNQDVKQTILNLAEFMDHSEKGPLPIPIVDLGKSAQDVKAYAKALRYKELEIRNIGVNNITLDQAHAIITFANKLNLQEEAAGMIKCVEMQERDVSTLMRSRWYEKLNDWDKALSLVAECRVERSVGGGNEAKYKESELDEHEVKCLEALGKWSELKKKTGSMDTRRDQKLSVMGARSNWAMGDWTTMEKHTRDVNVNTQDGSYLRAVLAVKKMEYGKAEEYIEKCRDIHDSQLTASAGESYERAYPAMILVQELTELEEAIQYRMRPERRARIALLWSRRLQGNRENVYEWNKLLMLRNLVLSPSEMHPLRVKFASLCRRMGKRSMCNAELKLLLGLPPTAELHSATPPPDRPQLVLALCKQLWNENGQMNGKRAAVSTLEGLSRHLDRLPQSAHSMETKRLVAKTFLKLGEWTEAEDGGSSALRPTMERRSTMSARDAVNIMAAKASAVALVNNSTTRLTPVSEDSRETAKIIKFYTKATEYDPKWHKGWHRLATAYFNALSREKEREKNNMIAQGVPVNFTSPLHHLQSPQITPFATEAVKAFTRALQLAEGSRLEDTLRLLALWFEYGDRDEVYAQLEECARTLPLNMWLEVTPQLMARLDSVNKRAGLLHQIVIEVAKKYPHSMVYALTAASKSSNETRGKNATCMLGHLREVHPKIVDEAKMVSHELIKCAILWHEQCHECLDEASRLYFQDRNIRGMFEALNPINKILDATPITLKEQSFYEEYAKDLTTARDYCRAFERTGDATELTRAWEIYYTVGGGTFKKIATQLRGMNSFDLPFISPILQSAKSLSVAVPGTFDPSLELVTISEFGPQMTVIMSKQRPRKLSMRGSDGKEYMFLLKGHEDPRQDERVMQFFGLVNTLLLHNGATNRRNLTIQRYSIVALSQNSGLIGWVPDCDTLHGLVKDYREKKKRLFQCVSLSLEHKLMQGIAANMDQLTLLQKVQLFEAALASSDGQDLGQILWLKSPNSEVWFERRTNYTRSIACMSMVGHILGLGDRHPSNLMLDRLTGKIVHIDFGDCFEVAQTREKYPEKIPFRLTRMLVQAMEITGIEGNFRLTSERVLQVLRSKKDSLVAVLEAFVYDPLINWRLLDVNKRNPADRELNNENQQINMKKTIVMAEVPEDVMNSVLDRIKLKISGREFLVDEVLTIEDHVDRLVKEATSHINLAQCYIGWCPFW